MKNSLSTLPKLILFIAIIFNSFSSWCQDSIQWHNSFHYEVRGLHNELTANRPDRSIYVDDFIQERRVQLNPNYSDSREYSDNPFGHFATYAGLFLKSSYKSKYHLLIGAYLEQRSASGGVNTTDNIFVFPRISIHLKDTIKLKTSELKFNVTIGSHYKADFEDFLRLYNLDFQAINLKIGIKNIWLNLSQIADLSNSVGLGLTEHGRIGLSYIDKKKKITLDYEGNWVKYFPKYEGSLKAYLLFKPNDFFKIQGQFNIRFNNEVSPNQPIAFGISNSFNWLQFQLEVNGRYYGAGFNSGYYIPWSVDYREPNNSYLGRQFYALKNFYRDFNQWSVFTEYGGSSVGNIEIKAKYSKKLRSKLSTNLHLDYNLINDFTNKRVIHYPIVSVDFTIDLVKDFSIGLQLSNKQMNLDVHYETFYVSKKLFLGLLIEKKIGARLLNNTGSSQFNCRE